LLAGHFHPAVIFKSNPTATWRACRHLDENNRFAAALHQGRARDAESFAPFHIACMRAMLPRRKVRRFLNAGFDFKGAEFGLISRLR
jgi:hypothetical protein